MSENKKLVFKFLSIALFFGIIVVGGACRKDENTMINYHYGVGVTSDYVNVQHLSISIANTYFRAIYDTTLMNNGETSIDGATVNYFPDSTYKMKIIYPFWGSDDGYGNWRKGEIYIQADGGFFDENKNAKFTFQNFSFAKDTVVAHDYSIKYLGKDDGNDKFQMNSNGVKRIMEDTTGAILFNSFQNFTVILSTENQFVPEKLLISGLMNGTTRSGGKFESSINSNVISDLHCNWMKEGEVEIAYDSVAFTGMVVFSDEIDCKNWYNLVIDGIDFPSSIEKPKWQ
jgi:hypothetical protein